MALINTTTTGVLGSTFYGDGSGDLTIQQNGVLVNKITSNGLTYRGTGSVLQVVSTTKVNGFSTSSTSFVDLTGLSVSITPTSATSNVMVFATFSMSVGVTTCLAIFNLVRNSTNLSQPSPTITFNGTSIVYPALADAVIPGSLNFLDSPATTSATTYKIQCRASSANIIYVNIRGAGDSAFTSTITAMEIAA